MVGGLGFMRSMRLPQSVRSHTDFYGDLDSAVDLGGILKDCALK